MPVLSVRPEERRLIPYEVQALYELGRISKEQLDNYVKTGSEKYLRSYEENLRTDPARQVGNLAAPVEKEAPWGTQETDVTDYISTTDEITRLNNQFADARAEDQRLSYLEGIATDPEGANRRLEQLRANAFDRSIGNMYAKFQEDVDEANRLWQSGELWDRRNAAFAKQQEANDLLKDAEFKIQNYEKLFESKGEYGRRLLADLGSNKESLYPLAGSIVGGAIGGYFSAGTGSGAGATIGSTLGSIPIYDKAYNAAYVSAVRGGVPESEAQTFAAAMAGSEAFIEAVAGRFGAGGSTTRQILKDGLYKRFGKKVAAAGLSEGIEELAAGRTQEAIGAGILSSEGTSEELKKQVAGEVPFKEDGTVDWQSYFGKMGREFSTGLAGGTVVGGLGAPVTIKAENKQVAERVAQGKAIYENIAKSGADVNTLAEARTAIARSLGLEADTIEDAQTLANRFKQNDVPSKVRAKAVAETILTGDPAFDAGQKAAQQTFQLAEQYKPVEATVTQFEPLARRPATPVQGNLGSFTVEAPVAKETLTERGLKKANLRLDKDTRMLDNEIAKLQSQIKNNVVPPAGVNLQSQLAEAETLREGIARERLRAAEKAKPAEPTPYAKEMRRFQEQPKVEVNAKIPEAPKISRAESITNKVAEEVTAKTKKELPENTKQRVTDVAALVENELTFSGALRGLDEKAADAAVLAKTREYLASGEKEADIDKRVKEIRKQRDKEFEAFAKQTSTALKNQDEVLKTLDRHLGKDVVDGLVRSDKVRVLSDFQRAEFARTQDERDLGQGVYIDKDGTIYLNAANLNKKDEKGVPLKREIAMAVLAHEQGHTKNFRTEDGKRVPVLKGLAGDAAYDALNKAIADSAKGTGRIADIAKRAQERAQSGVEAAQKAGRQVELKDELPQYFVEELVNSYDGPLGPFRKFIDETSAKARDIINRSPLKMDIRPQDLGWMVKQDLIAESKTEKTTGKVQPTKSTESTFKTEKGSVYKVYEDGTTERDKAARDTPGHEGDSGKKPRTAKTIYIKTNAAALSAAGLSNLGPKGARVVIKDGKATLLTWNDKTNSWGTTASSRDIPFSNTPSMGAYPLELWNKTDDVAGYESYSKMHAGNKIVEMDGSKPAKFSYLGQQAKGADQALLQKAKEMYSRGESAEKIRKDTGWFLNQWDNAWRFEVSDKDAKLKITFKDIPESELLGETKALLLKEILDHPTLFENYPELENVEFIKRNGFFDFGTLQGWYNDEQNRIGITPYAKDPLGTLLHEIQHWIQGVEGFGLGGNESSAFASLPNEAKATLATDALKQTETSLESDISARDAYTTTLNNRDLLALAEEALSLRDNRDLPFLEKSLAVNQISNRVKSVLGEGFGANEVVKYMHYGFHKDMDGFKQDFERRAKQATESAAKNTKTLAAIKSGDTATLLEVLKRTGKAYKFYRSLLGEIEARDVTNRKDLDVGDRVVTSPYEKTMIEDSINPNDVIVVKEPQKGGVNFSIGTKEATGFKEAKQQGKTFTSPVTGEEVFEIPDTDMKVNAGILRSANGKPIDLEVALVHDELFKQWPFLRKDVKIKTTDKFALNEAEYDPRTKTITISNQNIDNIYNYALSAEAKKEARKDISKTVLHEITHAIQDKIGAEMGSNPTFEMYEYVADKLRNMNNNKLAAEYSRVLNAVKRNQKNVDKLFQGISKLRDQWEAKGKKWPETYTDLDIHIANDPALAGQIMPFVKGLGLNNLRELHETYNFLRQAKNAGYWAYMANRGEVTARAVAHVFDGKFATLKEAEEAVAKQFGELSTQGNSKAAFQTFEKQAPQMKAKPAVLMSLGATIEVDGKTRPTTNSKGQPIADSVESARNFWRWFGDSKVVDAQGRPLVVYHGTREDFDEFKPGVLGDIWFTDDSESASEFAKNIGNAEGYSASQSSNVIPVYISVKEPLEIDAKGSKYNRLWEVNNGKDRETSVLDAQDDGNDGVIFKNIRDPDKTSNVYVAFRPEQIKSVNNRGTWSKEDPRILFSLAPTIEVDGKVRPTTNSKGQPIADSVESARNFWRWFGDSKVVDAQGRPLAVYHGTTALIEVFDESKGGKVTGAPSAKEGFFFTDRRATADYYAKSDPSAEAARRIDEMLARAKGEKQTIIGPNVVDAFLSIQNPLVYDFKGSVYREERYADLIAKAKREGNDGLILRNTFDAGERSRIDALLRGRLRAENIYITFRPEQIKSINNNGTWSKEDTRILFSLADDVKEKAQIASEAAKEKTSVAWKYLQGALWDMRPAKFKIAEEMRDGYVRYIEQKGREMAQRMVEAANKDGITLDALKEAWGQAREYGVLGDTGSAKVNALMQAMRDEIDSLSMQIEEVYDESGTPLSDKMKETFNKNLFSYISRSFEIDFNKGWSKKLLRAAKKDPNSKEATIINNLRSWLNDEIVARLESLELLDDKQIKSLYKRLIDEDVEGKSVETMTKALESFKGKLKSEELVDILQNDVLRLSKVSGVGNYYRGAARNEGILQKKTNIPSPILAAMGERVGPAESFLTTIVRQGSLFAQTKMLADFRKAMPESFTTDQTPENTVRIEDKQGKYGPLAGLYTTPAMKEYIEEKITQEEKMDALMTNLHSAYAQEELATRLVKGGLKNLARVSGVYKVWSIMTNTANYLYNMVNGAASLARYNTLGVAYGMDYVDKDGNKIPVQKWFPELAADFLWRGSVTGTSSHELYGLAVTANFVGSAMSGDIKEAFLDTIRETVEGKKPSLVKRGWRKATWLADAWFSGPEALPNILGVVVESNYLRKLWEAQALDFTHDELMAAAADRVKRNAISRDRAIPGAKFLDKYAAQAFLTFFTETVRAPMQTAYDAVMDVKESNRPDLSPKAKRMMRGHAAAHLAGAATTAAAIYGITQAIALAFGRPFGTEDDEDPEGLEEDLRDRPEDLIVIGTDKDGRKLVFDRSKLNTYSLITNVVREAAQGNLEGAGRQAKSFLFANPLPQKVWTELTDNYGEAGKSDVAIAVNNAIADTPLGQVVDPTTVNELVKVMSMFTPGFIKDPKRALENAQGLQENLALGFVGAGARPVAYQPVKTLRYQMGTALDELETARSKLNAAMRTKDASEKLIKQEMRRYYNAERDLILKNRPLVQAALKNNTSEKELRQLFKLLGANKHLNEQMLSKERYKPTAMHKNWLTMSEKLATLGEPQKVKEEQGMIYSQNKAFYKKLFDELYGNKE